jgi:uncharacterized protein (TIGR01777 family)
VTGAVLISGATGLIGGHLSRQLRGEGVTVRALSRHPERAAQGFDTSPIGTSPDWLGWDGEHIPASAVAGCRAVIHLSGEPVFGGRLSAARRQRIVSSRVDSTRAWVAAFAEIPQQDRPELFACASAVGYYGDRGDEILTEDAAPGGGFLADVCRAWEEAAARAESLGIRTLRVRIGIVLSRDGGALGLMALPFRFGVGGRLGSGRQWVPWIHIDDLVALLRAGIDDSRWTGAINGVAPNPERNTDLTRILASTLRRPARLPAPAFALRAALGELSGELLGSRRVIPERASSLGFAFAHPSLETALAAELSGP